MKDYETSQYEFSYPEDVGRVGSNLGQSIEVGYPVALNAVPCKIPTSSNLQQTIDSRNREVVSEEEQKVCG